MRQVFFHIGDRKTGTSSLQSVADAWDRSGDMRKAGVLYPMAGRQTADRINHRNLAHALDGDARYSPAHGTWDDFARNLAEAPDAGLVLVSSEAFENIDPQRLRAAVETHLGSGVRPVILSYFRPHISRFLASYTQNAKRGLFDGSLDSFVRKSAQGRLGQAFGRLCAWRDCFGADFRLSLYQRDRLLDGDIVADILVRQMGLPASLLATLPPSTAENRAPKPSTLATMMALRRALGRGEIGGSRPLFRPGQEAVLARLQARLDALVQDEPALQLDAGTAEMAHAACLADARAIDAAFFADRPGVEAALDASLAAARAAVAWENPNAGLNSAWVEAFEALMQAEAADAAAAPPPPPLSPQKADDRRARRKRRRLLHQVGNGDDGNEDSGDAA